MEEIFAQEELPVLWLKHLELEGSIIVLDLQNVFHKVHVWFGHQEGEVFLEPIAVPRVVSAGLDHGK